MFRKSLASCQSVFSNCPGNRGARLCLLLIGLCLPIAPVVAQQKSLLDNMHGFISLGFSDFVNNLDGLFGGVERESGRNKSWFRLRTDVIRFEGDSFRIRPNVKLRLVLPNTEERVRVLLSTEDEDNLEPGQVRTTTTLSDEDSNVSLALRFLRSVRDKEVFKLDFGVRFRDDELQLFGRINASRRLFTSENEQTAVTLINNFWFFSADGYENRLRLDVNQRFYRLPRSLLLSRSELIFRNGIGGADFVQRFGFFNELESGYLIGFENIYDFDSSPGDGEGELRSIEARARVRRSIWRDWFFYEVRPRVRWEADNNFSARYGLQLRAEVFVGPKAIK